MSNDLLKSSGDLKAKRISKDRYELSVTLPTDEDGRLARQCHANNCSPAYFKVKPGTGLTGADKAFCPYCRGDEVPSEFYTAEQLRYLKERAVDAARDGVNRMVREALGLGSDGKRRIGGGILSIEMSLKESHKPTIRRPFEDEVRRDVVCPHCGLDQSVFGLATWCADCGEDIFLTHVEAEFAVVRSMLADIDRRKDVLGTRVAAKDTENCLEDVVSIFEAVLKAMARRRLMTAGANSDELEQFFKSIKNAFQNPGRAADILYHKLGIQLRDGMPEADFRELNSVFDKRHPITHNLGVIDRKYLERAQSVEQEGKEVLVSVREIERAIGLSMGAFQWIHTSLFVM